VRRGFTPKPARLLCPSDAGFCRGLPYGEPLIQPPRKSGCAKPRRSIRPVPPVRAQGIRAQTGMRCWISAARRIASIRSILQGSALWHAPDPAGTNIRVIRGAESRRSFRVESPVRVQESVAQPGTLVVSKRRSVLQGSALWRTPDPAGTNIRVSGVARSGTQSVLFVFQTSRRVPEPGLAKIQFNGGARSGTQSVLLVSQAARLIPLLRSSNPTGAAKHTAILSAKLLPVRAQGIEGVRSSHTCRAFLPRRGTDAIGTLVIVESSPRQVGPERVSAEPRKARFFAVLRKKCAQIPTYYLRNAGT
jgi:hypothetical protein